jgi:hypothetical protein
MTHPRQSKFGHGAPEWTDAEVARLIELRDSGLQPSKIGPLMGRTPRSIIGKLHRIKAGKKPHGNGPLWTPEEDAMLKRMLARKASAAAVSAKLGTRTRNAVVSHAKKLGVPLNLANRAAAGGRKNNNPWGVGAIDKRGKFVKDGKPKGPDPLPPTPASKARVTIEDLEHAQCRFIGEVPPLITIDTPLYCGARTDGGSWCPEHKPQMFDRRPRARL